MEVDATGREQETLRRLAEMLEISNDPDVVLSAVQELFCKNTANKETIELYEERYGAMHSQLNQLQRDNFELRSALNKTMLSSEPAIVQVKQLLLDPAMNKEFTSLRTELETSQAEIRRLQGELDGLTFTQQSKAGRQLMAKCRKLQEENEEMGREISEGHVHELETELTASRKYSEELRRKFKELEAHCSALDEEAEDIQQQIFILKSQQEERSASKYRERSITPRRLSPDYRDPPEMYDRRRMSHSMERKRRPSEERGMTGPGAPPRDRSTGMSAHEHDREMSYVGRRYK